MFRVVSPKGRVILIDPWITGNPTCWQKDDSEWQGVEIILITHGHFDHCAGLDDVLKFSPAAKVVAPYELGLFFMGQGKKNVLAMNKGGAVELEGVKISMVGADHSSSFMDFATGAAQTLGEPAGYVVELEDGFKIYFAGDTGLTSDMKFVVADYYKPDLAVLPVSGLFAMAPDQAVLAAKFIKPKYVIPHHDFPEPDKAPASANYNQFLEQYPFIRAMIAKSQEFGKLAAQKGVKAMVLDFGETREIK